MPVCVSDVGNYGNDNNQQKAAHGHGKKERARFPVPPEERDAWGAQPQTTRWRKTPNPAAKENQQGDDDMGKTPERVSTVAPVLRYRRKVPSPDNNGGNNGGHSMVDNQLEHRQAEHSDAMNGDDTRTRRPTDADMVKRLHKQAVITRQALSKQPTSTYVRKKKTKPDHDDTIPPNCAPVDTADPAESHTDCGATLPDQEQPQSPAAVSSKDQASGYHKKKSKKKLLVGSATLPSDVLVSGLREGYQLRPTTSGQRKRKQWVSTYAKKESTSLLKQLLWKAKTPQDSLTTSATGASSVAPQQVTMQLGNEANDDEDDDQEERFYNESERHHRKLAATRHVPRSASQASFCPCSVEFSSQETQSGSDDESLLSPFQNLVPPSAVADTPSLLIKGALEDGFPTPFPFSTLDKTRLFKNHRIKVHEVVLDNFTMDPQQLHIHRGDVVVWRVSSTALAMVEHCLDITFVSSSTEAKLTASTPPLRGGGAFAWRFPNAGRIDISCSVYQVHGVIFVGRINGKKMKKQPSPKSVFLAPCKQKESVLAISNAPSCAEENDNGNSERDDVFHPPANLARSAEVDAGVCRAVLTQLQEVAAIVTPIILVGDVECPVLEDGETTKGSNQARCDFDRLGKQLVHSDDSGTEDEEVDDVHLHHNHAIEDFQQKIICMLQRSEEIRARHRNSFQEETSGFDAGAAYDFFKHRFSQLHKEERHIVYAGCPESQCGSGLGLTDVVSLLSGPPA